jgi:hypothetical protein
VRRYFLFFIQPMQQISRAVGSVRRQAVGLSTELVLRPYKHCLG